MSGFIVVIDRYSFRNCQNCAAVPVCAALAPQSSALAAARPHLSHCRPCLHRVCAASVAASKCHHPAPR